MSDPIIAVINRDGTEPVEINDNLRTGARDVRERVPLRYRDAVAEIPAVRSWVTDLVAHAATGSPYAPILGGRSLVLSGPTGTGKTWDAYGAIRALAVSGARCSWRVVNATSMFRGLQPSPGRNTEEELRALMSVSVLVIDDLGTAKDSPWREEVLYVLLNERWEQIRPTLITTNMTAKLTPNTVCIAEGLSDRVFSRVAGMSTWVSVTGPDRRRGTGVTE